MVITENGYGKKTKLTSYKSQSRAGSGIKTANLTARTGDVVHARVIKGDEDLIIISQKGIVIRTEVKSVSTLGRATQGVRAMKLDKGDKVKALIKL